MRIRLAAAIAVLTMALVTACTGGSTDGGTPAGGTSGASDKPTTISYLAEAPETTADQRVLQELVDTFQRRHPNIEVKLETIPFDQLRAVLQTRLRSGTGPDVFNYGTGPGFSGVLAKAGLLYDLTKAYEDNDWQTYDWAKDRVTDGGKLIGVPDEVEQVGIFYNKAIFQRLGISEPKTFAELEAAAQRAKDGNVIPLAFGNQEGWEASHMFSAMLSNLIGRDGLDEILFADGRWDTPEVARAIGLFFDEFNQKGYLPKSPNAISYEDQNSLFFSGKAAMLPTGTWIVTDIEDTVKDFEVGFFPFPPIDGGTVYPAAGVGGGWFVSAKARDPQAAVKFLDYVLDEEASRLRVEKLRAIPAQPVDLSGIAVSPLFQQVYTSLESLSKRNDKGFGYNLDVLTPARFNDTMYSGFQMVLNGRRTPEQQASTLQRAWSEAKKAGEVLTEGG